MQNDTFKISHTVYFNYPSSIHFPVQTLTYKSLLLIKIESVKMREEFIPALSFLQRMEWNFSLPLNTLDKDSWNSTKLKGSEQFDFGTYLL